MGRSFQWRCLMENNHLEDLMQATGLSQDKILSALGDLLATINKKQASQMRSTSSGSGKHGPCKVYMTIDREAHCLHCKSISYRRVTLMKQEALSAQQEDGTVRTVYALNVVPEPFPLKSYTQVCPMCKERLSQLTRVELEQAYMYLLSKLSFIQEREIYNEKR
jgi:hypothetical protein